MYIRKGFNWMVTFLGMVTLVDLLFVTTVNIPNLSLAKKWPKKCWTQTRNTHGHGHTKPQVGAAPHHKNGISKNVPILQIFKDNLPLSNSLREFQSIEHMFYF